MIATVRIAPMEHWCKYEYNKMRDFPEVNYQLGIGFPVRIDTASMAPSFWPKDCGGRIWRVLPESLKSLGDATGGYCEEPTYFCEHMLEMD